MYCTKILTNVHHRHLNLWEATDGNAALKTCIVSSFAWRIIFVKSTIERNRILQFFKCCCCEISLLAISLKIFNRYAVIFISGKEVDKPFCSKNAVFSKYIIKMILQAAVCNEHMCDSIIFNLQIYKLLFFACIFFLILQYHTTSKI